MTASTQGHAESRSKLARGLVFVGAATLVGNGSAYLLSIIAARILTPADFGAFGALLGILIIVSTLTIALQALTARRVATAGPDRVAVEGTAIRLSVIVGVGIILLGIVVSWPLGQVFTIPTAALAMGFASLAFVIVGCAAMGIAQGREEHLRLSMGFIANGVGRAAVGIVFVLLFGSVTGIAAGILIGTAVGAAISYLLICPRRWSKALKPGWTVEFAHVSHALIVLFTLTNVDVLLARFFLTENQSGEYAVGVLLAKIAFFLPNAIIIVLFPKMTSSDSRRTVLIATGLTAVLGAAITAVSFTFGSLVVRILGGTQYPELNGEIWLFALEGSAFALVQVLLYARLAAQDRKAVTAVWVALVILVGTVAFWRNGSVVEIVTTVVAVSLVLTVAGLFLDHRNARRNGSGETGPLEPIEAAE